jgi:DtxR family Mn-dependent transcriptional regulator
VLERIDALLGHPQVDPHGDPIPSAKGSIQRTESVTLAGCEPGARFTIDRTLDQDPAFLRFLDEQGLRPGVTCHLVSLDEQADALQLEVGDQAPHRVTLGGSVAQKLMVRPEAMSP